MNNEQLRQLLKQWLAAVADWDSRLCWGCGELKSGPCEPSCLVERTRRAIEDIA